MGLGTSSSQKVPRCQARVIHELQTNRAMNVIV